MTNLKQETFLITQVKKYIIYQKYMLYLRKKSIPDQEMGFRSMIIHTVMKLPDSSKQPLLS
jgi:hypothetical protein